MTSKQAKDAESKYHRTLLGNKSRTQQISNNRTNIGKVRKVNRIGQGCLVCVYIKKQVYKLWCFFGEVAYLLSGFGAVIILLAADPWHGKKKENL
jgi:hypothetical protein